MSAGRGQSPLRGPSPVTDDRVTRARLSVAEVTHALCGSPVCQPFTTMSAAGMPTSPAGAGYHDPLLFLVEEAKHMPPEVQDWIETRGREEQWIAEFQLNLVRVTKFVEHWEYQRDYVSYAATF